MVGLPSGVPEISASLPVAEIPLSQPRIVPAVTPPTPSASAPAAASIPRTRSPGFQAPMVMTPHVLQKRHEVRLKALFGLNAKIAREPMRQDVILEEFRQFALANPMPQAAAPPTNGPHLDPDLKPDPEKDPALDDIIVQLQELIDALKKTLTPDESEESEAKLASACLNVGQKLTASKRMMALVQKMAARAQAVRASLKGADRVKTAFAEQVADLNRALVPPSQRAVASVALGAAAFGGGVPATRESFLARYAALDAESKKFADAGQPPTWEAIAARRKLNQEFSAFNRRPKI